MSIISDVFAGGAEGILKGVKGLIETVKADLYILLMRSRDKASFAPWWRLW